MPNLRIVNVDQEGNSFLDICSC